jgi:hypothetical protein
MRASSAAIIGIYGKYRFSMAAFALRLCTIIQIQACMVSGPRMTGCTGLITFSMNGLGTHMTQTTGWPVKRHIGYVCNCVHMVWRIAFIDMA